MRAVRVIMPDLSAREVLRQRPGHLDYCECLPALSLSAMMLWQCDQHIHLIGGGGADELLVNGWRSSTPCTVGIIPRRCALKEDHTPGSAGLSFRRR